MRILDTQDGTDMYNLRKILVVLLFLPVIFSINSCKKNGIDKSTVTFVNRTPVDVTLTIYGNEQDYANNANEIKSVVVAAGENLRLSGDYFKNAGPYYMDWYSQDYYYNNWFNDDYPVIDSRVRISPTDGDNTYYLEPGYKGKGRAAFLGGSGTETSWIAVGAYLYSSSTGYNSQWDVIKVNERYRRITMKKDFTAGYIRRNDAGADVTTQLDFMVQQAEVPYVEFKNADGSAAGNMTGGKLPTAPPPAYSSQSVDTVMALFPDNDYIFMMVRQ